ncbi:sensor histidine kinase [Clostridium akagii]|uniref:sensor histidine kinase n=1 Tax=Clostridium akagii TaxID=91623 RepID=UPI0006906CDD|nr:HAMP domain-containing sensor histidine kinase [Clostridium akagii]
MKKLYNTNRFKLPGDYRKDFYKEILTNNTVHLRITFVILFIVNIIFVCLDIKVFKSLYKNKIGYRNVLYANMLILFISPLYVTLITVINKKFHLLVNRFIVLFIMTWSTFLSINAQLTNGQVSAYILGIFCISSIIIINPFESLFLFLLQYVLFVIGILNVDIDWGAKVSNLVSASLLTILALALANINYAYHFNNFKNKKLLSAKNEEINNLYIKTEDTLKKRTEQFKEANALLIKEMNEKHEMELQIVKTKLLIEEKQKLLNEKIEYEKLRTDFFANISHELRTPLTVIFSAEQMLDLIIKKPNIESNIDDISKYIHIIKQNCYRLIRLIGNLIDITKMDSSYFELTLKDTNIVKIVEDITLSVADFIEGKDIGLVFDTEIEEKVIAIDEIKMERVILNLLSNSVKFTPPGGNIYVNIYDRNEKIVICVKDTGIGIPSDRHETIFDRFVQVDKSLSRNREGSGIGLSIVSSIIKMHKGAVRLKSQEGIGSEFIIELPVENLVPDLKFDKTIELSSTINTEMINIEFSDIYS